MNYYDWPADIDTRKFKYCEPSGYAKFIFGVVFALIVGLFAYYQIQKNATEQDEDEYRIQSIRSCQESMFRNDSRDRSGPQMTDMPGRSDREEFEALAKEHETIIKKHPRWADKYPPIRRVTDDEFSELQKGFDEERKRRNEKPSEPKR